MSNIWFIADLHLGHQRIMEFESESRPFTDLDEMTETIIQRYNSVVKTDDIVWFLGDVAMGKKEPGYLRHVKRMNGRKKLLQGNHDLYPMSQYMEIFERVFGVAEQGQFVLSHIPVHRGQMTDPYNDTGKGRFAGNICGHLHSKKVMMKMKDEWIEDPLYFVVSVEQNNLYPFNYEDILKTFRKRGLI